jgi:hypothetical protein
MVVVWGLYPIPRSPCANRKSFFFKGWGVCFRAPAPNFWRFPVPMSSRAPCPVPRVHVSTSPRPVPRAPCPHCAPLRSAYLRPVSVKQSVKQLQARANDPQKSQCKRLKKIVLYDNKNMAKVSLKTQREGV